MRGIYGPVLVLFAASTVVAYQPSDINPNATKEDWRDYMNWYNALSAKEKNDLKNVNKAMVPSAGKMIALDDRFSSPATKTIIGNLRRMQSVIELALDGRLLANETICPCTIGRSSCGPLTDQRLQGAPPELQHLCITEGGCMKTATYGHPITDTLSFELNGELKKHMIYECLHPALYIPVDRPLGCRVHKDYFLQGKSCCKHNFCSIGQHVYINRPPPGLPFDGKIMYIEDMPLLDGHNFILIGVVVLILLIIVTVCSVVACGCCKRTKKSNRAKQLISTIFSTPSRFTKQRNTDFETSSTLIQPVHYTSLAATPSPYTDACETEGMLSTGSGSGVPLMTAKTFATSIKLLDDQAIGVGRFGEVWKGEWKEELVAVKIFNSFEESSYYHECSIYQTNMLRHPNILAYRASDNHDSGLQTQLWLVTEYHEFGSVSDFLQRHSVTHEAALRMMRSMICGLDYLHTNIKGTNCKPIIAHRDIKSRNIMVKNDLSCCIGDLGLAVRYDIDSHELDLPKSMGTTVYGSTIKANHIVGTVRYLAPELLDHTFQDNSIEAYIQADIYAMALVFWEVARCASSPAGAALAYELPYYDLVSTEPSYDEMRWIVSEQQHRPTLPKHWEGDETMNLMQDLMTGAWTQSPRSRYPLVAMRKQIEKHSIEHQLDVTGEQQLRRQVQQLYLTRANTSQTTAPIFNANMNESLTIGNKEHTKTAKLEITHVSDIPTEPNTVIIQDPTILNEFHPNDQAVC